MSYRQLRCTLRFLTPAFLGDAEQNGRWRTPPFKAQLRQWWRVAYAFDRNFNVDVEAMRREEGLLFGNAWLDDSFCKSRVRLRLSRWETGRPGKEKWLGDETVMHPEVTNRDGRPVPVGSALYLGYGPLTYDARQRATSLKANAAIQAYESAEFSLAFQAAPDDGSPDPQAARIEQALALMDRFGTVGGRSRNGWGSYLLRRVEGSDADASTLPLRRWQDCLDRDWPHAIGRDDRGPLIWQTQPFDDWRSLMKRLAELKIGLRTQKPAFDLQADQSAGDREIRDKQGQRRGIDHGAPQLRHWLSYPVTNHSVRPWGNNARLPNTLRFKVRPAAGGKLVGVIFHMPHLPPPSFNPDRPVIEDVWSRVHAHLDAPAAALARVAR